MASCWAISRNTISTLTAYIGNIYELRHADGYILENGVIAESLATFAQYL